MPDSTLATADELTLGPPWRHRFSTLGPAFYPRLQPTPLPAPYGVGLNRPLAAALGLDAGLLWRPEGVEE